MKNISEIIDDGSYDAIGGGNTKSPERLEIERLRAALKLTVQIIKDTKAPHSEAAEDIWMAALDEQVGTAREK